MNNYRYTTLVTDMTFTDLFYSFVHVLEVVTLYSQFNKKCICPTSNLGLSQILNSLNNFREGGGGWGGGWGGGAITITEIKHPLSKS